MIVDNCDNKLPVQQENVERGSPQRQCLSELPLNSPLTMPVFLPLGTTLIVSDPSTLKIVRANSSQNLPPKAKTPSSPVTVIVENEPLGNTSSSCATPSLLKCSQPIANPNSPVDNGALAMKGMAADNVNHTTSPPGSFNLAQPYSCLPRTVPIEHIRLQAIPTPGIRPSPSTETTHIYKTNPVTASIPIVREVKIVSLCIKLPLFLPLCILPKSLNRLRPLLKIPRLFILQNKNSFPRAVPFFPQKLLMLALLEANH